MTPVTIVGAGPVGATLALLLARHGVRSTVLERRRTPIVHPAAHVLSTRSLEVWRELGLERAIRGASAPLHDLRYIVYCTTLAGRELGRVPLGYHDPAARRGTPQQSWSTLEAMSPTRLCHLSQSRLEPILWRALHASDAVDFRPGVAYRGHSSEDGEVRVRTSDAPVVAHYLVGADGAASPVRRALGIEMQGPVLQQVVSVHCTVDIRPFMVGRRGPVVWIHDRRAGLCTFVIHRAPDDVVFQIPYFPPFESPADFTARACAAQIRAAVGVELPVTVHAIKPWVMTAQIADRYGSGPVLLAGDAAHRFPPTGGLGLNTGVADVHALAWRLAWVLAGQAPPTLLESYEAERRPLAVAACEHSVRNFERMFDVYDALGIPVRGRERLEAMGRSVLGQAIPRPVARALVRGALSLALQRLRLVHAPGRWGRARRRELRRAIERQWPHYAFWGLDLGAEVREGFVVPEPDPEPLVVERFEPKARSGRRLPHAWLHHGGRRVSTLDLADPHALVLLCHAEGRERWAASVRDPQPPIRLVASSDDGFEHGSWESIFGLDRRGALLIRPDGIIAWRGSDPAALCGARETLWGQTLEEVA